MTHPPRYHIPTHLQVPDTIDIPLFGITVSLTMRQFLCLLFGWGIAFHLWQRSLGLEHGLGLFGVLVHWGGPLSLAFLTYVIAHHSIRGRHLEAWAAIMVRYLTHPKVFVWCCVLDVSMQQHQREAEEMHREEDGDQKKEQDDE